MSGDKTEKPTAKRLRDARKKGQIPKSAELVSTFVYIAVMGLLLTSRSVIWQWIEGFSDFVFRIAFTDNFERELPHLLTSTFIAVVVLVVPVTLTAALVAVIAGAMQTGGLITMEPIIPKPEKVNPMAGLKKIFSGKTLVTFALTLLKAGLLAPLLYAFIKGALPDLMRANELPPAYIGLTGFLLVLKMMFFAVLVFLPMSVVDVAMQIHFHIEQLKMSKHDVKQDFKETEGDPFIKSHRKALAKQMVLGNAPMPISKASAVVTNPTHLAVALYYDPAETPLPIVIAKGADERAALIREIARAEGVPMMRNVPLARQLYAATEENEFINSDAFEPVAELLLWADEVREALRAPEA
ncbi:EscU/YscU/HrcU family type III secretion system export apparatus switch protein [Paraburkholderia madseniana]|uniref:EscU/YscU/HrcU family type III secretion system export apparatus switch protein n=1 Tax=Paraburkholderia madseniana TaxID=2599607 RepID=A0A6N6W1P3_9BURK|nr:EscU/YscU/HrcU family type III secretion system export apparatus switch protein [Paraburkholderia madseniana]KAE8753480.1 EscU/YscU/HrcU family type III secretion system export apparatus switch protein [Paraburkholderia madseniana]